MQDGKRNKESSVAQESSEFFTKYQNLPLNRAEISDLEDDLPQNLPVRIPVLLKFVSF